MPEVILYRRLQLQLVWAGPAPQTRFRTCFSGITVLTRSIHLAPVDVLSTRSLLIKNCNRYIVLIRLHFFAPTRFFTLLLHFWFNDLQSSPCTAGSSNGIQRTRRRDEVSWLASQRQTDCCRAACHGRHGQGAPLRRGGQDAKPCRTPRRTPRREGRQGRRAHRCLDALRGRWPPR